MKYTELRTPSYIVQEGALVKNLKILKRVREEAGVKILLAEKAFSMYRVYPLIARYLDGTTASGICEAKLAHEEFVRPGTREGAGQGRGCPENHVFEPAYKPEEMRELCEICTHIYFNSLAQLELHRPVWEPYQKAGKIRIALRINPEFSTQEGHAIYDPCAPGSRLGIRRSQLPERLPEGVTGLHFHTLCEQGVGPLIRTFRSIEKNFPEYLRQVRWINMGGGHHITRADYDVPRLIAFLREVKERWNTTCIINQTIRCTSSSPSSRSMWATVWENSTGEGSGSTTLPLSLSGPFLPRSRSVLQRLPVLPLRYRCWFT